MTVTLAPAAHAADSASLLHRIQRLGTVGTVLYVAAHPDDENTRLLAYLSKGMGLRVVYLSMTRGDGGQNRIGDEQSELLGVIRTEELLAARRIDGGEQRFTRAKDFGYSKSPKESLSIWGHREILSDVVWAVRQVQPDVIITRFATEGRNHGHHTASAILAREAFAAAPDPGQFEDQLQHTKTWKPTRLVYNVSTWRLPENADMSAYLKMEVGGWDPLLGRSYGELAAEARSQHKSQGFGISPDRGEVTEYFEPLAGPQPKGNIFEGVDLTWRRFEGGAPVAAALKEVEQAFDVQRPWASVPGLLKVRAALAEVQDAGWRERTRAEVDELIVDAAGLYLEAAAASREATPGSQVQVTTTAILRTPAPLWLDAIALPGGQTVKVGEAMTAGKSIERAQEVPVPPTAPFSSPFWLTGEGTAGRYEIEDPTVRALPVAPPPLEVTFNVTVEGVTIPITRPVVYKWTDRVEGERFDQFDVVPPVTVTPSEDVMMAPPGRQQSVSVVVRASAAAVDGTVRAEAPEGWTVTPARAPFKLDGQGAEQRLAFEITAPAGVTGRPSLRFFAETGSASIGLAREVVEYPHFGRRVVLEPAEVALVPLDVAVSTRKIGYIPGSGDTVAQNLEQLGYDVTILSDEDLAGGNLAQYDVIIIGVRAYNVNPRLWIHQKRLMNFAFDGGTVIAQYQTNNRLSALPAPIGPYPFEVTRDRVTDETAPVDPVDPKHKALTTPNALGPDDWTGWVQERGLYFADAWDSRYEALLKIADPGEEPLRGSLLLTHYGAGVFVYTGLSLFRQLPAGVPGAYRLLANLIAYEP